MAELTLEQMAEKKEALKKQRLENLKKARENRKKNKPAVSSEKSSSSQKEDDDGWGTII